MAFLNISRLPRVSLGSISLGVRALSTSVLPKTYKKIQFTEHGQPEDVLKLVEEEFPPVNDDSVVTETIYSAINPADINQIEGVYPIKPTLPGVAGNEGISRVIHVGKSVKGLVPGDWVIPAKSRWGMWQTHAVLTESDVLKVPKDIPAEYAGTITVNPSTAYTMMHKFVDLKAGDIMIQNGGTSAVALSAIQLAAAEGIITINVIRDNKTNVQEMTDRLKALGANYVVTEEFAKSKDMKKLLASLPSRPKLGLNCVGGRSSHSVFKSLCNKGVMVTYGGMSKEPVTLSTSNLIFDDRVVRGFWMTRWYDEHPLEERMVITNYLFDKVRKGQLKNWFQFHDYRNFQQALLANKDPNRGSKVLLKFSEPTK